MEAGQELRVWGLEAISAEKQSMQGGLQVLVRLMGLRVCGGDEQGVEKSVLAWVNQGRDCKGQGTGKLVLPGAENISPWSAQCVANRSPLYF